MKKLKLLIKRPANSISARVSNAFINALPVANLQVDNTTIVIWEPSTHSHAEVIPGFAKYVCDLGYSCLILTKRRHLKSGLFSRFPQGKNLRLSSLDDRRVKKTLRLGGAKNAACIIITSARNVSRQGTNYDTWNKLFLHGERTLLVEHDFKDPVEKNFPLENVMGIAPISYGGFEPKMVNPNYFGYAKPAEKKESTNFLIVGAGDCERKDISLLCGDIRNIAQKYRASTKIYWAARSFPPDVSQVSDFINLVSNPEFSELYDLIDRCHFLLPLFSWPNQKRYITTGTSGVFQLANGFLKPLVVQEVFLRGGLTPVGGCLTYKERSEFSLAFEKAVLTTNEEYTEMQACIKTHRERLAAISRKNLQDFLVRPACIASNTVLGPERHS